MMKNIFYGVLLFLGGLVFLYQALPSAYGYVAFTMGLPVTERIKQAAPEDYLAHQARRLHTAEASYNQNRAAVKQQRERIQAALAANEQPLAAARYWLAEARKAYQARPDSPAFDLAGKQYTPAQFGQQVVLLQDQVQAYEHAGRQLRESDGQLNHLEVDLVKAQSSLQADRVRLDSARLSWETRRVLDDFDLDLALPADVADQVRTSDYILRSAQELSSDQATLAPEGRQPDTGLSSEALAILSAG
jgi:hypothetical protein